MYEENVVLVISVIVFYDTPNIHVKHFKKHTYISWTFFLFIQVNTIICALHMHAFPSVYWPVCTTPLASIHPPVSLFFSQSVCLSIRLLDQQRNRGRPSICVSEVGREMHNVGMAIGDCLTQTNIIHPGQYPKMANDTDQLAG